MSNATTNDVSYYNEESNFFAKGKRIIARMTRQTVTNVEPLSQFGKNRIFKIHYKQIL